MYNEDFIWKSWYNTLDINENEVSESKQYPKSVVLAYYSGANLRILVVSAEYSLNDYDAMRDCFKTHKLKKYRIFDTVLEKENLFVQKTFDDLDVVLYFSWCAIINKDNFGNCLADFVDSGKSVIIMAFGNGNNANQIGGRFLFSNYCPFVGQDSEGTKVGLKVKETTHPIFKNVDASKFKGFERVQRSYGTMQPDSYLVAKWSDGLPFCIEYQKYKGKIVCLNFSPIQRGYHQYEDVTENHKIISNAIKYCSKFSKKHQMKKSTIIQGTHTL